MSSYQTAKFRLFLTVPFGAAALVAACSLQGCSASDQAAGGGAGSVQSAGASSVAGMANGGGGAPTSAGDGAGGAVAATSGASGGGAGGSGGVGGGSGGTNGGAGAQASGGTGGNGGAGGSVGGNGGAGGSPAYDPCPTDGSACKVMPLGDSITDGCCGQNTTSMGGSYRVELFRLSLTHNKKLTFVGSHQSGPNTVDNVQFPRSHEGNSGWTIADGHGRSGLQTPIAGWLKATPPDIVTLMIGTNDVDISFDLPNAPNRLGTLLDTIISNAPKALIVLAKIAPTRMDDENLRDQTFNDAMPALVKARTDMGKHVILVDIYGAFTKDPNFKTTLMANPLHPTDAGYAVMANTWWDAIGDLLPAK